MKGPQQNFDPPAVAERMPPGVMLAAVTILQCLMGDAVPQQLECRSWHAPNPDGIRDAEGKVSTLLTYPVRDIDVIVSGLIGGNHGVLHYRLTSLSLSPPQLWVLAFLGSAPPQPVHTPR